MKVQFGKIAKRRGTKRMKNKMNWFDYLNYVFLFLLAVVMLYPFINIIAISFSSYQAFVDNPLRVLPKDFTIEAYKQIMQNKNLYISYGNTIYVTLVGTIGAILLYVITAYPLSKKELRGRKFIMYMVTFTMVFHCGTIPNYLLMRSLGLLDTLSALIFSSLFTGFNLILVKNFFESMPQSLIEAAKIDGATEMRLLWSIVAPLSKPILATVGLFTAVGYWNNFMSGVLYIQSQEKWPLMLFLREIILGAKMNEMSGNLDIVNQETVQSISLQYATLLLVVLPILCVYPFLQKYFVKGVMVGAVKG